MQAVDRASKILRERTPGAVTMKGDRDPATEVDYAIERELRAFLLTEAPGVGFLGEEDGRFGGVEAGTHWALDPIDGTVNFMHGIPLCAVSLGLVHQGMPVIGVIDLPLLNTRYSATLDGGAYRESTRLHVGDIARLEDAVVAIGDYAVGGGAETKNSARLALTRRLAGRVQRIRMLGSAAIDLAWVAEGRITASVMLANKAWDTVAGVLLAREAGAVVVDRYGSEHALTSDSTIAASPAIADELVELVNARLASDRPSFQLEERGEA